MNPEHYVRIKEEINHDRDIPAIVDPNIIVIDSDDDTITYASSSRSLSPEPSASNAINNEINRTHDIIEIDVRDDNEIDLIDVENIIADNKLIIEKYKEGSKVNKQNNDINDVIIKGEFPTTSNTEFLNIKNKKKESRNEIIHKLNVPSLVQDDIILIEDEVINNVMISNASNRLNRASITQCSNEIIPRRNCASEAVIDLPSPTTTSNHEQNIRITCPVCFTSLSGKQILSTTCGHIFCMDCIQSVLRSNIKKCPTCRKKITKKGYHQIYI